MKKLLICLLVVLMLFQGAIVAFADDATVKKYDTIEFGNYPQSLVTDAKLIKKLDKVAKKWESYNYDYIGTDDNFMQYADFTYEGVNYRGVNFVRPRLSSGVNHCPNDDMYPITTWNMTKYFKYEPITWIVVDAENGIVVSEKAIDSQEYAKTYYYDSETERYYTDSTKSHYANEYSESAIRSWLNDTFVSTAFTGQQAYRIVENTYKLEEYHYLIHDYTDFGSINDKIVIPTVKEYKEYGFGKITVTDYSRMQGYSDSLNSRTIYDSIMGDGSQLAIVSSKDSNYSENGGITTVRKVMPMMKLNSLTNDTSMISFDNNAKKCNCICHSLHHSDNFFGKLIYEMIRNLWDIFNASEYCKCGLRHNRIDY